MPISIQADMLSFLQLMELQFLQDVLNYLFQYPILILEQKMILNVRFLCQSYDGSNRIMIIFVMQPVWLSVTIRGLVTSTVLHQDTWWEGPNLVGIRRRDTFS